VPDEEMKASLDRMPDWLVADSRGVPDTAGEHRGAGGSGQGRARSAAALAAGRREGAETIAPGPTCRPPTPDQQGPSSRDSSTDRMGPCNPAG
jgi:hypothetical protein